MSDTPCSDCSAPVGTPHRRDCDVAVCLWHGGQRLSCEHFGGNAHDCGADVWTGEFPGHSDAIELGFFTYWGPDFGERGWIPCGPDHPGARPDLNRLHEPFAVWDREQKKWRAP